MQDKFTRLQCTTLFSESIKSKYTKKNYDSHLAQFQKFANIPSTNDLAAIHQDTLQYLLENYLIELKQTANPNSIPSKFQGIKHFCIMNRIHIDWDIIYRMFPRRQITQTLRSYTNKEICHLLANSNSVRDTALIHFLASTGARIGVFDHGLTLGHIQNMPYGCKAVRLYARDVEEYWAFLTPQASEALDTYHNCRKGEKFNDDTPIFATRGINPRPLTWNGARSAIYRIIAKSDLSRHKSNGRYNVQADHGFRKRFNTILKLDSSVNPNVAEKLLGHKNGLDGVYFTPTIQDLFTEFSKVINKIEIRAVT